MPAAPDLHVQAMVRLFIRMCDRGRWNEGEPDWPDEHRDGAVDAIAYEANGRAMVIEHTLTQPFARNLEELDRLKRFFLPIEQDPDLIQPEVATYLHLARGALRRGVPCATLATSLRAWLAQRLGQIPVDGETRQYRCSTGLVAGSTGPRTFRVRVRRQQVRSPRGFFLIRRFGRHTLKTIASTVARRKVRKLLNAAASKRVLLLEREDWGIDERAFCAELGRRLSPAAREGVEVWFVESASVLPASTGQTDFFDFRHYDATGHAVHSFAFLSGDLFSEYRDGMPVPMERRCDANLATPSERG